MEVERRKEVVLISNLVENLHSPLLSGKTTKPVNLSAEPCADADGLTIAHWHLAQQRLADVEDSILGCNPIGLSSSEMGVALAPKNLAVVVPFVVGSRLTAY